MIPTGQGPGGGGTPIELDDEGAAQLRDATEDDLDAALVMVAMVDAEDFTRLEWLLRLVAPLAIDEGP